jgi:type IX secretion system PorP/SprF family membrane protein
MINRYSQIFFLAVLFPLCGSSQDIEYIHGYQMPLMINPALAGNEGDGMLRLSYFNFYPGENYNLNSVYLSYDAYFSSLHGGAGFYISDDYQGGIINDLKGGFSYAYFLQAGRDIFINAGLSASFYHRGYSFNGAIFPDQIDPLGGTSFPPSEIFSNEGRTVFDIGTGFTFIAGKLSGGLSINHLAEPSLSETDNSKEKLKRKYFIHMDGDLNLNKRMGLSVRPLGFMSLQGNYFSSGAGVVFESNYLAISGLINGGNSGNLNMQTGFSVKTGRVQFYYNYYFNIVSENSLLPLSLIHHTGLTFSLYNVDKRNTVKTINFPKL